MNSSNSFATEKAEDEISLIKAAQCDLTAFEPLYQHYMLRIYRYLSLRVGNAEDAADLTQQVFLKALSSLPNYHPRGAPFAAWLFRIAHYTVSDVYRQKIVTISWDFLSHDLLVAEINPEQFAIQREQLTQLAGLLARLDPYKRELLALRFSGELSASEIALVVDKSQAAVKKQLTRTLQQLKEQMA
ncbi:RNA polymerase sigma factor [Dictyobacter kobayashii]|uniref:DNA-directed RNA polymerase sigma-70 factor n=1 Tax=Dictyobacter kobayashii TaxID=2014872 RepID=A0A402ATB5_9CHLR|nr:sigma-70 family RNA polymerase sigma factor [Dictyobacter kobayashii]GCE22283.1 DNA-directed RNA polymerase sigma-70 factor [Dictyobacter kobayashii]